MSNFNRLLIAYAVAIPLALVLGYLVATPDVSSLAVVGMVLFILVLPLLIQHGHWLLIFFWNSAFMAGFLPGQLPLWLVFAMVTFIMGLVHLVMGHRSFLRAPELTKPLLFLTLVVILTAKIRGGLGLHILGNASYGGKNYFFILGSVMGYFGLISMPISMAKSARTVKWFFLSAFTNGLSDVLYLLGPAAYFAYYFISSGSAGILYASDMGENVVKRYGGFGPIGSGLLCFILARWGLRGIFDWNKPWRLLFLAAALAAALFSGFRSQILMLIVMLAIQFILEGLWKTSLLPIMVLLGGLCLVPMILFADKMPSAVQRSLAFLPVDIDANVRAEADSSTDWRLQMWRVVWPEVPKYLLIGKGYSIDPTDLYLTSVATRTGLLSGYEGSLFAGDYHNGPLSVLMPFGIFGAIAFVWLLGAGVKVLHNNYRYGDTRLRQTNMVLLSYFLTQCLFFILVFGALNSQLSVFLGILGFSVSLNGGVCRRHALARQNALSSSLAAPAVA